MGTESQPSHSSSQASKELYPKVNTRQGHAGVRETDKRIAMEMCGKSHRKIGNTDLSSKATRQIGGDQPGKVEGDIGGTTATPQGPLRNQTPGETPYRKSETRTKAETVSKDTVQEGRQCDGTDQRDRRKETAEGTLRT